jgi:acyl-CoA synthetase (AMP-forming)/AMP-acid ligase II
VLQPVARPGEIVIKSPHRMAEYFRDPEQTAEALRDGWFHTGDLGYARRRRLALLRRPQARRHPPRRREHVVGADREDALRAPGRRRGGRDRRARPGARPGGEGVHRRERAGDAEELRAFAAERLAKFQVPRLWEFRDALPKTPTQRVEKYKLRQESGGGDKPLLG